MRVLVTGGAGYIGSITVSFLLQQGYDVVVFDNLKYGHRENVSCELIEGDLTDKDFINRSLKGKKFDGVIHFAAYALAGESMHDPYKYFQANLLGGLNLLDFMDENEINKIVFSSSCAIYGTPEILPVTENESKKPESVYGESKLMFENILRWYDVTKNIKHINLRYFNAAGASLDGKLGEWHNPETHIIPIAMKAVLEDKPFNLFGSDYDTKDGSCIRDYIHVEDLAIAHSLALNKLFDTNTSDSFNLGSGIGYSNLQIIDAISEIAGKKIEVNVQEKRKGDPSTIYADISKAKSQLGFLPQYSDLDTIIKTAWKWHSKKL